MGGPPAVKGLGTGCYRAMTPVEANWCGCAAPQDPVPDVELEVREGTMRAT